MAVMKMHFYNISFDSKDLMKMLMKVNELQDRIYPQDSKKIVNHVQGVAPLNRENPYNEPFNQLEMLIEKLQIHKIDLDNQNEDIDLQEVQHLIDDVNNQLENIEQIKNNFIEEYQENEEAITLLNHLIDARISLDDIKQTKYMTFRFGKVPSKELRKIQYYKDYHFIYQKLSTSHQETWVVYCGLTRDIGEIDNIFMSMNFQNVSLPVFAHGDIEKAIRELEEEAKNMTKYIGEIDKKTIALKNKYRIQILDYYSQLSHLKLLYDQSQYVVDFSQKNAIYAFSGDQIDEMKKQFSHIDSLKVIELPVDIYRDRQIEAPVIVKNHPFFQPFENMMPHQGDKFDATWVIGVVLMLTSLICLGDIAVGAIVGVIGTLLSIKKKTKSAARLQRVGGAIFVGGLIYGSVFYQMQLYKPLFSMSFSLIERFMGFVLINIIVVVVLMIAKKLVKGGV